MLFGTDDVRDTPPIDDVRPDIEGRFSFTNVPPGHYRLFLRSARDGPSHLSTIGASADVIVTNEDIRNVALDLQPGVTVSGHIVYRGSPSPPVGEMTDAGLEIRLDPAESDQFTRYRGSPVARPDATGQFVLHDVFPGEYRISATAKALTRWFLDTSTIPGADVTGQLLDVKKQDLDGVTVMMTDQRAEVMGTLLTDKGEPAPEDYVLVYPTDQKFWTSYSRRLYGTRAKPDGTFVISGLQPGSYRLATLLDAEFGAWFDPAFLRRIDGTSMPLSIATNDKKVLNLRVPSDR